MTIFGTIVNGQVQLDHAVDLPDGMRVAIRVADEVAEDDDEKLWDELDAMPIPPPSTETYEEYIASLKRSHEEALAGGKGYTIEETMLMADEIIAKSNAQKLRK